MKLNGKKELLYIDDEEISLRMFQMAFRKKFKVHITSDYKEALKLLEKKPNISVVLSDFKMPEINGIEFLEMVKSNFPSIYRVILSGISNKEEILAAKEKEICQAAVSKPFDKLSLQELIESKG